jgi:hypothetical protein
LFRFVFSGGDYRSESSKKRSKQTEEGDEDELIDYEDEELDSNNNEQLTVTIEEADLLRGTLSDLLRNLLSDRVFADTLPEMIAESIPYFTQLQYTRSPRNNNEQQQQQQQDNRLLKDSQIRPYLDDVNIDEHDQSLTWSIGEQETHFFTRNEQHPKGKHQKYRKETLSTPGSLNDFELKQNLEENERLKNNPNITSLVEDVIENTIWNILQEAYHSEFSLTARPRLIALPPKRQSSLLIRTNLQQTDSNQFNFPSPPLIMTESFD